MRIEEIKKLKKISANLLLTEWVKNGEAIVVDVYFNEEKNETFQVSEKFKIFRKTIEGTHEIRSYGKWESEK